MKITKKINKNLSGIEFEFISRLLIRSLVLFCVIAMVSGCLSMSKIYPDKRYYVLDITGNQIMKPPENDYIVKVSKSRISPTYSGKGFVYRKSDINYESDFYNEFLITPDVMICEEIGKWLSRTGLFKHVMTAPGPLEPDYVLESSIVDLYGDYRNVKMPSAVMEIQLFLIRDNGNQYTIEFQKQYREEVAIDHISTSTLSDGWNIALKRIMSLFENDIKNIKLKKRGQK